MKICYIARSSWIHTRRWLEWFAKRGHEVHLIDLGPPSRSIKKIIVDGVISRGHLRSFRYLTKIVRVRKIIKRINPDILHTFFIDDSGYLAWLSGFHPYIVTVMGSDLRILPEKSRIGLGRALIRRTLKNADLVISVTEDLRERAIRFGVLPEKSHINLWGIDFGLFHPNIDVSELKKKLGIESSPVILSARQFAPIYNIDVLVKSIPLICEKLPNAKFVFCGSGYGESDLKRLVRELRIEKSVRFVGYRLYSEMPRFFNLADVVVSVTSSDGTPSSLLEAMACGAVPVVSDIPPYHEWIIDERNGLIVPVRDEKALSKAILKLLFDRSTMKEIARTNLRLVEEKVNQDQCMANMEKLYYGLIS